MDSIQLSIISTLALYSAEGRSALTAREICLWRHKQTGGHAFTAATESEVKKHLAELIKNGLIFADGEYYSLENHKGLAEENIKKARQSAVKIKKNKWPLMFLRATVPFARAVAITGSVAMRNARPKSDLDLLIITKKGRIWTTRIFALLIIELFRRRREDPKKSEKICLNFFIAEGVLAPVQNIAAANLLRSAVPLYGNKKYRGFLTQNKWIENFLYHQTPAAANAERVPSVAKIFEYLLSGKTGDWLERFSKDWQYRRLSAKVTTPQNLNHFILTDEILMLHYPDPKNKKVMEKYERIISGLTTSS